MGRCGRRRRTLAVVKINAGPTLWESGSLGKRADRPTNDEKHSAVVCHGVMRSVHSAQRRSYSIASGIGLLSQLREQIWYMCISSSGFVGWGAGAPSAPMLLLVDVIPGWGPGTPAPLPPQAIDRPQPSPNWYVLQHSRCVHHHDVCITTLPGACDSTSLLSGTRRARGLWGARALSMPTAGR